MVVVEDETGLKWLEPWLRLPFYQEHYKCNKHPKKYNVVCCAICQENPQCEICWDNYKTQHQQGHHIVLQVMISSGRAAIKRAEISKYLDVSDIQKYIINSKDIVFLNPSTGGLQKENYHPKCVTCRRQLIPTQEDKGFRFCSISCKKERMESKLTVENQQESMALQTKKRTMEVMMRCCSLRKRSRKGIPHRAPLK